MLAFCVRFLQIAMIYICMVHTLCDMLSKFLDTSVCDQLARAFIVLTYAMSNPNLVLLNFAGLTNNQQKK